MDDQFVPFPVQSTQQVTADERSASTEPVPILTGMPSVPSPTEYRESMSHSGSFNVSLTNVVKTYQLERSSGVGQTRKDDINGSKKSSWLQTWWWTCVLVLLVACLVFNAMYRFVKQRRTIVHSMSLPYLPWANISNVRPALESPWL